MTSDFFTYLCSLPMSWLLATLLVYRTAIALYRKAGMHPLLHPVAVSTVLLGSGLHAARVPYATYFDGARCIHLLLGPVTVALAIPLYGQLQRVRQNWKGVLLGALAGAAVSIASAMSLASALGASRDTVLSMAAKSVTMPIAIALTEQQGGSASLTSALVMLTGIFGAAVTLPLLQRLRLAHAADAGLALGVAAHGIGTSKALQAGNEMAAFAGLAMSLAGIFTALLAPWFIRFGGLI